jgi:hypothetical protein
MAQAMKPLVNRILGGTLDRRLKRWRAEGHSYDSMARLLGEEGIDVNGETVRRWCHTEENK